MEGKENNIVRKVELVSFIDTLINLYQDGLDFVDICLEPSENPDIPDKIKILGKEEYLSDDSEDEEEEKVYPALVIRKLTDDDINNLV